MEPGLRNALVLAISLCRIQFDLAVQHKLSAERIGDHFADVIHLRLLSSDPILAAEFGSSYLEIVVSALVQMIRQHNLVASPFYATNDRLIEWLYSEVNRVDKHLNHLVHQSSRRSERDWCMEGKQYGE